MSWQGRGKYSDELRRRTIDEVLARDPKIPNVARDHGIGSPPQWPIACDLPQTRRHPLSWLARAVEVDQRRMGAPARGHALASTSAFPGVP